MFKGHIGSQSSIVYKESKVLGMAPREVNVSVDTYIGNQISVEQSAVVNLLCLQTKHS